jgi:hypothetical protein
LGYVYDFGDGWTHDLTVEKVLAPRAGGALSAVRVGTSGVPA